MENLIAWILMAAISLPVSFIIAGGFLRAIIRLMNVSMNAGALNQQVRRDVL